MEPLPTIPNPGPAQNEGDVRDKAPKSWDEVLKIQQVLEAVVRSYARVTARPPPIASPYGSYRHQRAVFQRALDHYWQLEGRPGPPPELASLGPWNGPIMSITEAPVEITEEDLEPHVHPLVRVFQPVEGSILWIEQKHNFDN